MKKNKVFVNKIEKINNNQNSCVIGEKIIEKELTVEDKLNKLFNMNGYIFNVKVEIITNNKTYNTRIANRIGNSLITLDNDVINIDDIKDIIF